MNYCAGCIRQQENQQLGIPPEAGARRFPRRLQELVGYSIYNGLIGHIDKQHPAKVVLAENEGVDMVWDLLEDLSTGSQAAGGMTGRRHRPDEVAADRSATSPGTSASRPYPSAHARCQRICVGVQRLGSAPRSSSKRSASANRT